MKRVFCKSNLLNIGALLVSILVIIFVVGVAPPDNDDFPIVLEIEEGDNLSGISKKVKEKNLVRSPLFFRTIVIILEGENSIPAGDYYFNKPEPVYTVAQRIVEGDYGLEPIRVTLREGWDVFETADYLDERFVRFDKEIFFEISKEGYLAPDTYFFSPLSSTEHLVERMESNFESKWQRVEEDFELDRSKEEIVIMASILEKEANTIESKRKIADILWRRLEDGMPLQVDASFSYVNNKNTYQLTLEDLKIDNPYNTYKNTGLPPTPIANPGMNAIMAAIDPIDNPYWYFLSDLSGNMYYGRDFDEHQYNRENYLRK
ncbi:MAG: endolytic transglycosylase MltG [Patescibacteria group bacterium]